MADDDRTSRVLAEAMALGFSDAGVVTQGTSRHLAHLGMWLDAGRHGEMAYLATPESRRRRGDLRETMSAFRSAIVVTHDYGDPDRDEQGADPRRAIIARYARGDDYHRVMAGKLGDLASRLTQLIDSPVETMSYVDTGPLLERELAQKAGLGWFGKNTMLINPKRGSYFFLGVLLTDVVLEPSEPFSQDHCGSCVSCLEACPTDALLGRDGTGAPIMDARRCISYLTIELKGSIPEELRPLMGNRVFGCDICQEVCPWNQKFGEQQAAGPYDPRDDLEGPDLVALAERIVEMSEKGYQRAFAGSPLSRPRRKGMLRNLCVGLGNWAATDPLAASEALPVLRRAAADAQPLVREHATWALAQFPPESGGVGSG